MHAKSFLNLLLGALLSLGLITVSTATKAELIGTEQLTQPDATQDKVSIDRFISRTDVQSKLQEMGLSAIITAQRVALLSDSEARELSQKIASMPAGGNASEFSNNQIIIILLVVVLVALIL